MIEDIDVQDVDSRLWAHEATRMRDAGLHTCDWLTAVDRSDGHLEVLACFVEPASSRQAIIRCRITSERPVVDSIVDLFPGADWHERETAEMFGVEFSGRSTTPPLLLRADHDVPPLRKAASLPARVTTPWPGAEGKGRRRLAPGVRAEWVGDE